jgi:hypothetical protein
LTEAEAMALLNKPAEDPEEWVTQDRVPARVGIDYQRWSDWMDDEAIEVRSGFTSVGMMHGDTKQDEIRLELRCRRKDLPPIQPQPAPIAAVSREERLLTQLEKMVSILEQQGEILKQLASHKKN